MAVAERLERVYRLAHATGHLARFVVFGSFVTDKLEPHDVDVFLEAALVFDHSAADAHFGASVFWVRRLAAFGGEHPAVEYWQVKREGGRRGILEITEEMP
jgi:hypothetical protein